MADLQQDPARKGIDPTRIYDGWNDLSGGMDASRSPEVISDGRYSLGVNVTSRDGMPCTRPPFVRLELVADDQTFYLYRIGLHQGSGVYYNPTTGVSAIVSAVSGRLFSIDPESGLLTLLSSSNALVNDASAPHYFCQAESFLVINNGLDTPLIFDGSAIRRATTDEVPTGTIMAYGQGRIFVAAPDRIAFVAGDLIYGGSQQSVAIKQSARIESGGEVQARITTVANGGLAIGDTVTITGHSSSPSINGTWKVLTTPTATTFTIAAALTSGGAGGTVTKANDGKESDVLRFTERNFQNERGIFRLPATMGKITAMTFFSVQDTATGQGDLLVFGERGACSFSVAQPRTTWLDIQMQRITFQSIGCVGPNALTSVNGDIFFRSWDGLRSYRNARAEQSTYGQTPLSGEVRPIIQADTPFLLPQCSMALFSNRLFFTAQPRQVFGGDGPIRSVSPMLVALDFDQVSRIQRQGFAAYDGVWTGLNIQQIITGNFGSLSQGIMICYQSDGDLSHNEVWMIRPEITGADRWVDCDGVTQKKEIECALETKAYVFEKPLRLKQLVRTDLWIAALTRVTTFRVYWRPDIHPAGWFHWLDFTEGVAAIVDGSGNPCATMIEYSPGCFRPACGDFPSFAPQTSLGTPPYYPDAATDRRAENGYSFQLRVEWTGNAQIQKNLIHAAERVESWQGRPPSGASSQPVTASPRPRNVLGYEFESTSCDAGGCVSLADFASWPVNLLSLSVVDDGGPAQVAALEGEYDLISDGANSNVWRTTIYSGPYSGSLRAMVSDGNDGFDVIYQPLDAYTLQFQGFAEADSDCVPSPIVANSSSFS